jgi:tetratricopeptide (TPR) repeat protein
MKKLAFIFLLAMIVGLPCSAQAQSPQQTLNQYVADLQKNPNDYALREKIIRHVQVMKQKPAVPEEARQHFIEGNTLLKAAKDQRGYGLARDAYRQCLLVAPWWADAYNNYAVALELSGQFDDAVSALKLYIATNPGESESRKAQDKIYEIGAKKKIAAQEKEPSHPKAVSTPQPNTFEDLLRKIDGRRYTFVDNRNYQELYRTEIKGREFTEPVYSTIRADIARIVERYWSISESGESITLRARWSGGEIEQLIYLWQR